MSWNPALDPKCHVPTDVAALETLIIPRTHDLGGFEVRRALPSVERQMVGPFIFFDQMGPAEFITDGGIDVRPHPHIGLGTVTYLFQGEFQHRDSLGTNQMIYPGEVNWMVAGHGVTHSERTSAETRAKRSSLFGIQTWLALPESEEDRSASFEHRGQPELPMIEGEGKKLRLIMGNAYGERAPVSALSNLFYLDAQLEPGAKLPLPDDHEDRGIYVLEGSVEVAGETYDAGSMLIFRPGDHITAVAGDQGARMMLLGGDAMGGPRYIKWNFVASSREKIEHAARAWMEGDWEHGRFQLPPGDDKEHIPLPDGLANSLSR
ncbi:MAG: pirin family protein [Pseudomonadota bacterium]